MKYFQKQISKNKEELNKIVGELVGITKISYKLFNKMIRISENLFNNTLHVAYETDCLVEASKTHRIYYELVDDLIWSEIDDEHHYKRAKGTIYPKIQEKDYSTSKCNFTKF